MAKISKILLQISRIEQDLEKAGVKSFTRYSFSRFFSAHKNEWELPKSATFYRFLKILSDNQIITKSVIFSENEDGRLPDYLYAWKTDDIWTIIQGLKHDAYFSHLSAVVLHDLTNQIPKTFYLNNERTSVVLKSKSAAPIQQSAIDRAFLKEQRRSERSYRINSQKILLLNGQFTNRLGVIKTKTASAEFNYTDLERTLIDITVRPGYAGGVFDVLEAYKKALPDMDIPKLIKYLKALNYVYPYHQAIGFYLEKAGCAESYLRKLELPMKYDFYLTYGIRKKEYAERWKLYYPKGF
ncbi:MAG: hypothetical protein MUC87_04515 [Bacteroidia bacterium]|jgi:hypothetical protein|nr:hypothetical protein [Bacteroidia bacterium]